MISNDHAEVVKVIVGLAANFGVAPPEALFDLWHKAFQVDNITTEELRKAASKIIRSKTDGYGRMPTYAEILAAAGKAPAKIEDKAIEQAAKIISAVRQHGNTKTPRFKNPITATLMTGRWNWASLCQMKEDQMHWWQKDFVEAYRVLELNQGGRTQIPMNSEVRRLVDGVGKQLPGKRKEQAGAGL